MSNNPFLSIITVGLDESEIIETLKPLTSSLCLASLEIIVATPFLTDTLREKLPNAAFISDPGYGVYSAMNEALRFASGVYVWFLNAGDQSLIDLNSINSLLRDLSTTMHIYSSNKLPIVFFGSRSCCLYDFFSCNRLILKLTLLSLGMPISHQNILIPLSAHKPFLTNYRYSSDYSLLIDLIFRYNIPCLCRSFKLARLAPGGISDINRFSVLAERFRITAPLFSYAYSPVSLLIYVVRVFREALACIAKKILHAFFKSDF